MHQQLWGYKVELKSVSRGTGGKKLNTTGLIFQKRYQHVLFDFVTPGFKSYIFHYFLIESLYIIGLLQLDGIWVRYSSCYWLWVFLEFQSAY